MKRLLAFAAVAAAVSFAGTAQATGPTTLGGQCDSGNIDVACRTDHCSDACTPVICLVWGGYGCKV